MSVRSRAIRFRVAGQASWRKCWQEQTESLHWLSEHITTCIADRDAHRRLDDDGAPPLAEPYDPYFDLIEATRALNSGVSASAEPK